MSFLRDDPAPGQRVHCRTRWPGDGYIAVPVVFACLSFLWKGGGTQDPAAQDLACLSSRRKDKQPGPGEHGWLGLACLFYLKKVSGPWAAGCGACLFFRGEKRQWALVKPGLACLFYLKSCSPLGVPDSRIGGGEKTACLSFLSKRAAQMLQAVLRIGK